MPGSGVGTWRNEAKVLSTGSAIEDGRFIAEGPTIQYYQGTRPRSPLCICCMHFGTWSLVSSEQCIILYADPSFVSVHGLFEAAFRP